MGRGTSVDSLGYRNGVHVGGTIVDLGVNRWTTVRSTPLFCDLLLFSSVVYGVHVSMSGYVVRCPSPSRPKEGGLNRSLSKVEYTGLSTNVGVTGFGSSSPRSVTESVSVRKDAGYRLRPPSSTFAPI